MRVSVTTAGRRGARTALRRACLAGLGAGVLGATLLASTASAAQRPIGTKPTLKRSWNARILLPTMGRAEPSIRARATGRVSPYGPYDREPQYLLVLGTATGPGGPWYKVQLPERPNGASTWVRGAHVRVRPNPYRIRVRLASRRVQLFKAGRLVTQARAVVGTDANPTPTGLFAISEEVPQNNRRGFFGPYILTLTAHSEALSDFDGGNGQVAIHGTSQPQLLGTAASHGCVRLANPVITRISRLVPPGTPVAITAR